MMTSFLLRRNRPVGNVAAGAKSRDPVTADNILGVVTRFNNRESRLSSAAMVLVLHGAVIAMVLGSRASVAAGANPGLIAFDVPAGGARKPNLRAAHPTRPRAAQHRAAAPTPVLPITLVAVLQSLPDALPIMDASLQELAAATGAGCDLTPQVQDALRQSDEIRRQLPAIPAARRSIANAIVVWNAGWIDPGAGPAQTALSPIRQAIEQAVAASSADCRNQVQAGPRLIYLPDGSGKTTVLALGSGQWRWQQLIDGVAGPATDRAQSAMTTLPLPQPATLAIAPSPAPVLHADATSQTPALNALLARLTGQRSSAGAPYYP